MQMIQQSEIQGSKEWLELRKKFDTASEAPAMMNASPYQTRTELLDYKKTGIQKDVDAATQKRFDNGHAVETMARTIVEHEIGQDLFPETLSKGKLLASLDGKTLDGEIIFEHKAWNETYAAAMRETGEPVPFHYWQLEHQLLVSDDSIKAIFVLSDGFENKYKRISVEYVSKPERRQALIAGWYQFNEDLQTHVVETVAEMPVAAPVMDLPAVTFKLDGLALTSNLDVFKTAALALVEKSKVKIETDQDFADCDLMNKKFKDAEDKIKQIQANVLGEISDVDMFTKELGFIAEQLRQARLNGEKQVKNRKDEIKADIVKDCQNQLATHIEKINSTFDMVKLPSIPNDFGGALKNLRTISSLRDSAKSHLAECKIKANEVADLMRANLLLVDKNFNFLFRDIQQIITKETDDFVNLVNSRISEFKAAEQAKAEQKAIDDARKAEQAKAAEAFKETLNTAIYEVKPEHQHFETPKPQEQAPVSEISGAPVVSANDMLAMREFRNILLALEVPQCESSKGDIMASNVKGFIQKAINEINWIVN